MQKKKLVAEEAVQQAKDEATIQVSIVVLLDVRQMLSMRLKNVSDRPSLWPREIGAHLG